MKTQSVSHKLRTWLEKGRTITQLEALDKWGCMRLGARVEELRKEGMDILTTMVSRNGKRFAKYSLQ